jgi:site-specific DNA-methyltransferase (adenine-specific)
MKEIESGSVDMILCDLPYGTTLCKWDTVIPFEPLWEQYRRVIKPNGAIVLFSSQPFTSALVMSNPKWFKYDWVWRKPKGTGHLNAKKQPMRDKEDVLVFYTSQPTYNPQFGIGEPYKDKAGKDHKSKSSMSDCYGDFTNFRNDNEGKRYPKQVIEFGVVERGTLHPTQKPVALLEYLIKTYTNEGERVLDNTMGSGSTGIACLNTNRNFIGIEKDEGYFKIASERIAQARINSHVNTTDTMKAN